MRKKNAAFTFVEILAAMTFLAILTPVITEAIMAANRASIVAERSVIAAQLAETRLNALLLNDDWMTAEKSGDFGKDWPDYRWELRQETWATDSIMTRLTVEVFYPVQGKERSVQLDTLLGANGVTSVTGTGSSTL